MNVSSLEEDLRCKIVLYDEGLIDADQVAQAAYLLVATELLLEKVNA